jgi:hypothetical protein
MLPAGQNFNKDFFAGTVLPSIVDDRALIFPKPKASGTVLHLDNAQPHLTSDKYDKFGIKKLPHPPDSRSRSSVPNGREGVNRVA